MQLTTRLKLFATVVVVAGICVGLTSCGNKDEQFAAPTVNAPGQCRPVTTSILGEKLIRDPTSKEKADAFVTMYKGKLVKDMFPLEVRSQESAGGEKHFSVALVNSNNGQVLETLAKDIVTRKKADDALETWGNKVFYVEIKAECD